MADVSWPLPKFYFKVEIDDMDAELGFQAVEGLEAETTIIEYRHGNSPVFSKIKRPGLTTYNNVVLKKGVFTGDTNFYDWFQQIAIDRVYDRRVVTISLLDEEDTAVMVWELNNAFLVKLVPSELNSEDDGDPAIEEMEIAYETFVMTT